MQKLKVRRGFAARSLRCTIQFWVFLTCCFTIIQRSCYTVVNSMSIPPLPNSQKRPSISSPPPSSRPKKASKTLPEDIQPTQKIQFVNFWGTKLSQDPQDIDPYDRSIPCVETLDLKDGPLPPGAYVLDGKPTFEPKRTCRISLNLGFAQGTSANTLDMIRQLQTCVDAGFQTFEWHQQTAFNLNFIALMQQHTPSYVETHWSLRYQVPTSLAGSSVSAQQLQIRQSVVSLLRQSKMEGDTLDSLQLEYNHQSPYTLDTLDYLAELQREGLIRSIGLRGSHIPKGLWQEIRAANMGHLIDFVKQPGNLLLPPQALDSEDFPHLWMEDALAGRLLTVLNDPKQMSKSEERQLREWASRCLPVNYADAASRSLASTRESWQFYLEKAVDGLEWIALKYRVSPTAVALRWALERGSAPVRDFGGKATKVSDLQTVSSAMINFALGSETFEDDALRSEWRKVFRFELDEEDISVLQDIPASSWEERRSQETEEGNPEDALNDWERELLDYERQMQETAGYVNKNKKDSNHPEIDFNNKALWL
jgi:hypothetical protein